MEILKLLTGHWIAIVLATLVMFCTSRQTCDPTRDYLCGIAHATGDYDKCSEAIADFPETWGVCEVRDCQDLDMINKAKGMSPSERKQVNNVITVK